MSRLRSPTLNRTSIYHIRGMPRPLPIDPHTQRRLSCDKTQSGRPESTPMRCAYPAVISPPAHRLMVDIRPRITPIVGSAVSHRVMVLRQSTDGFSPISMLLNLMSADV